jgi:hypothetical protein
MSQAPRPDEDADFAGVRALLGALPDPGPLPEDVEARILAALHREALAPRVDGAHVHEGELVFDDGSDLLDASGLRVVHTSRPGGGTGDSRPRPPRTRRWVFGLAAAASVAALALGVGIVKRPDTITAASMAGRTADRVEAPAAAAAAGTSDTAGKANDPTSATPLDSDPDTSSAEIPTDPGAVLPANPAQLVHLEASGRDYRRDTLATDSQALLDTPGPEVVADSASTAWGVVGTRAGFAECAATLGLSDADAVAGDLASYEGAPVLVVIEVDGGVRHAYVVSRACSKGDPELVVGPVPMP